ncbi:MAG: SH3 domain-containing protein [Clostridia bacterium]|nr:SH3 domain-containing protein [Clostridia bacterium]
MKKTLALLLALITMLTVSLASCSKKEEETPDENEQNFVFNNGASTYKSTGTVTDESGNVLTNTDFISISGTSYILHPVKVREKAKNSSNTIGTADWGAAVELVEKNSTWTKIKFTDNASGATLEGYVRNELLTGSKEAVTKKDLDTAVAAKIVNLGTKTVDGQTKPITLNVRTTPWNSSESVEYKNVNVLSNISNKKYEVKDGDEVEKLATTEDGKWVYIKFVKSVDGVETTEWGWCAAQYVSTGEATDTPVPDTNTPPVVAPIE